MLLPTAAADYRDTPAPAAMTRPTAIIDKVSCTAGHCRGFLRGLSKLQDGRQLTRSHLFNGQRGLWFVWSCSCCSSSRDSQLGKAAASPCCVALMQAATPVLDSQARHMQHSKRIRQRASSDASLAPEMDWQQPTASGRRSQQEGDCQIASGVTPSTSSLDLLHLGVACCAAAAMPLTRGIVGGLARMAARPIVPRLVLSCLPVQGHVCQG